MGIPGAPFDARRGVIPNKLGQVRPAPRAVQSAPGTCGLLRCVRYWRPPGSRPGAGLLHQGTPVHAPPPPAVPQLSTGTPTCSTTHPHSPTHKPPRLLTAGGEGGRQPRGRPLCVRLAEARPHRHHRHQPHRRRAGEAAAFLILLWGWRGGIGCKRGRTGAPLAPTSSTQSTRGCCTSLLFVWVGGWVGVCVGLAPINPINAEQAVAAALLLLLLLLACCSTATAADTLSPLSSLALLFASLIPFMCD